MKRTEKKSIKLNTPNLHAAWNLAQQIALAKKREKLSYSIMDDILVDVFFHKLFFKPNF